MTVRLAELPDVPRLAELSEQLGYPTTAEALGGRLRLILSRPDEHVVYVAIEDDGTIVGWIHVGCRDLLETIRRGEICGLVVDQAARGRGIGAELVAAGERWVLEHSLGEMVVRSNAARTESHPFYETIGYQRIKSQHVYKKKLGS